MPDPAELDGELFGGYLAVLGGRHLARALVIAEIDPVFSPPPVLLPTGDELDVGAVLGVVEAPPPPVPRVFAEAGFTWVGGLRPDGLAAVPLLDRCHAHVDPSRLLLQVRRQLRVFHRTGVGQASSAWWSAVRQRRQFTLLLAPSGSIVRGDGGRSLGNAVHGGCVLGGHVDVTVGPLPQAAPIAGLFRRGFWDRPTRDETERAESAGTG